MKLVNGAIELEQCERPGSIGDSCAETSRYAHLKMLLGDYVTDYSLMQFVTPLGYIRHPDVPEDWKEKDFSNDQALPLFLAFRRSVSFQALEMKNRLKWRVGNGDLISPGLFAELHDSQFLRTTCLLAQLALWKLPWRYNEAKNKFEANENSSADYLNFIHVAVYAPRWLRRRLDPGNLILKVCDYYLPEPNCQEIKNSYVHTCYDYFGKDCK